MGRKPIYTYTVGTPTSDACPAWGENQYLHILLAPLQVMLAQHGEKTKYIDILLAPLLVMLAQHGRKPISTYTVGTPTNDACPAWGENQYLHILLAPLLMMLAQHGEKNQYLHILLAPLLVMLAQHGEKTNIYIFCWHPY